MSKSNMFVVVLLFIFVDGIFAQEDQLNPQVRSAFEKIERTIVTNPGLVPLGSLASLNLQPGSCFVPPDTTKEFMSPLIIIDPVDENRNVASALSIEQYNKISQLTLHLVISLL